MHIKNLGLPLDNKLLAALPRFLGDPDRQLERCNTDRKPVSREVWLIVHNDLRRAPAVRAVASFLEGCLR